MQSMFASYVHSAQTDVYIPLDCANGQEDCCCTCKAGGSTPVCLALWLVIFRLYACDGV